MFVFYILHVLVSFYITSLWYIFHMILSRKIRLNWLECAKGLVPVIVVCNASSLTGPWPSYYHRDTRSVGRNSSWFQIAKFMGPTWVLSAPVGPHIGPMNIAIRDVLGDIWAIFTFCHHSTESLNTKANTQGLMHTVSTLLYFVMAQYLDSKVHGAHLGPTGPRWAPCWPHELCYLGTDRFSYPQDYASGTLYLDKCLGK